MRRDVLVTFFTTSLENNLYTAASIICDGAMRCFMDAQTRKAARR
jgi:hypothetical protein